MKLDPEDVEILYFHCDSTREQLGLEPDATDGELAAAQAATLPFEVSLDEVTWTEMAVGENKRGRAACTWTVAGPGVTPLSGAVEHQFGQGSTWVAVRKADNPRINVTRFRVDIRPNTH